MTFPPNSSREDSPVIVERNDRVVTLRLNRPSHLNALTTRTYRELGRHLQDIWEWDDVCAVVLMGQGRAFSAGADLKERQTLDTGDLMRRRELVPRVLAALEQVPVPTVAAIRGCALGGGLELALACDFRIVAADATLRLPEVTLGVIPGAGATSRLPRLVGVERAKELIFTGQSLTGAEAADMGLAGHAVPEGHLDQAVRELTGRLSQISPVALRQAKKSISIATGAADQTSVLFEAEAYTRVVQSKTNPWPAVGQSAADTGGTHYE